ncbi:MAG TPA: nucleoside deaminase [Chitinophagaceae bacterium]|nr:nucleoside deaminase [Chitinophagaceae bacterium]
MPMDHEHFMKQALFEAGKAFDEGEVPIGAVVVINNKIIARGYNQVEKLNDPTAHAEIIALTSAFNYLGSKYLPDATLYVTIEPCLMCTGALYWSKTGAVVYGAEDEKNGYRKYVSQSAPAIAGRALPGDSMIDGNWPFHPKTQLIKGVLAGECAQLMKDFFAAQRQKPGL